MNQGFYLFHYLYQGYQYTQQLSFSSRIPCMCRVR